MSDLREAARRIAEMCGRTCDHIVNYSKLPCEECVLSLLERAVAEELEAAEARIESELHHVMCRNEAVRCIRYCTPKESTDAE